MDDDHTTILLCILGILMLVFIIGGPLLMTKAYKDGQLDYQRGKIMYIIEDDRILKVIKE